MDTTEDYAAWINSEHAKELEALQNDLSREAMRRYNESMKELADIISAYEHKALLAPISGRAENPRLRDGPGGGQTIHAWRTRSHRLRS